MQPGGTDIAIVGAGVAGIAAALAAGAHGLRYRLIEGRGRTGGRTWTTRTPLGRPFDLGASWIHAADGGNSFADIALAHGAAPVVDQRRRVVIDAAGALLPPTALEAFHAARPLAIARIEVAPAGSGLADCLAVADDPSADPWAWTMRSFAGPLLCGTDCALTHTADWAAARAGTDWLLPAGYGTLVQAIAAGEREADPVVRDVILGPLRRLLGAAAVNRSFGPAPVTRWGADPFAFGSYAIARPVVGVRLVLAEPLLERVHLAGEATALDGWHGPAGGAWLAGRAAVQRIAGTNGSRWCG